MPQICSSSSQKESASEAPRSKLLGSIALCGQLQAWSEGFPMTASAGFSCIPSFFVCGDFNKSMLQNASDETDRDSKPSMRFQMTSAELS